MIQWVEFSAGEFAGGRLQITEGFAEEFPRPTPQLRWRYYPKGSAKSDNVSPTRIRDMMYLHWSKQYAGMSASEFIQALWPDEVGQIGTCDGSLNININALAQI